MVSNLISIYFGCPQLGHITKANYETSDCSSRDMLYFAFSKKDLGLVSPPLFLHDFLRKIFLMSYSIKRANFIIWLHLLLTISGNIRTLKFDLAFLSNHFSYITKNSEETLKYLKNEKNFQKRVFFKGFLVAINCLRPERAFLKPFPRRDCNLIQVSVSINVIFNLCCFGP